MTYKEERLLDVSKQFQIYGEIQHAEPCKIGHINETYTATYNQGGVLVRYIHQRINTGVFQKPQDVMDNVARVTRHLRQKLVVADEDDITRKALVIIPTHSGKSYYRNHSGECWRTFVFIENAQTFETVQSPEQAYEAAFAFGRFQCLLADLPGKRLAETIPDFHNTRKRFIALQDAVRADTRNRAKEAASEIAFALKQEPIVDVLLDALKRGEVPERITHNDTKFNNVMLDNATGKALAVVDLDTVMPGLVHYDFGDMVRTTTSPTAEDELDLSKVRMQMPMFKALARGYIEAASPFLKKKEKSFIAFAGKLITYTIGIRFLTDFLQGDTYFRVHRPHHNLDRCRAQFKLVESIVKHEDAMQKYVDSL
ncbi:MAG: aminoglycoside phosphotransferase family protein [Verrucomicrobia bacterium]|nr:aminoglycoside phosphotransferase family protein [Verrucomicrobiota bacterium]